MYQLFNHEGETVQRGLDEIELLGAGLQRPECVLATASGDLFASNWRGGVSRISPQGEHTEILATGEPWLRPNGIALRQAGTFLLAQLGDEDGGVFEMHVDGSVRSFLTEVDGTNLPPTNYVVEDEQGRTWITVSTRQRPRAQAYDRNVADGFIVVVANGEARVVADDLGYTNEAQLDPTGAYLYVNETFAKRLSRFRINDDASLGRRETVAEFGYGTFPDGLMFDENGGIWITSIISNRVLRLDPDTRQSVLIEDSDPVHLDAVETAFRTDGLQRPHLDTVHSRVLRNISSLAFGSPDRRTAYLGCLLGGSIASFRTAVAGVRPVHWNVEVPNV